MFVINKVMGSGGSTIFSCFLLGKMCVTEADNFKTICLFKPVLETALSAMNNLRGDKINYENK